MRFVSFFTELRYPVRRMRSASLLSTGLKMFSRCVWSQPITVATLRSHGIARPAMRTCRSRGHARGNSEVPLFGPKKGPNDSACCHGQAPRTSAFLSFRRAGWHPAAKDAPASFLAARGKDRAALIDNRRLRGYLFRTHQARSVHAEAERKPAPARGVSGQLIAKDKLRCPKCDSDRVP
jgi:hypothetical protein